MPDPPLTPIQSTSIQKIQQIILNEIDTELYLKSQQLSAITTELGKAEQLLSTLRSLRSNSGSFAAFDNLIGTGSGASTNGVEKVSFVYEWTVSGKCMRLQCPVCNKRTFLNLLGFSNHCRIVHGIEFMTPEERVERCGIEVEDEGEREFASARNGSARTAMLNATMAKLRIEQGMNAPERKPIVTVWKESGIESWWEEKERKKCFAAEIDLDNDKVKDCISFNTRDKTAKRNTSKERKIQKKTVFDKEGKRTSQFICDATENSNDISSDGHSDNLNENFTTDTSDSLHNENINSLDDSSLDSTDNNSIRIPNSSSMNSSIQICTNGIDTKSFLQPFQLLAANDSQCLLSNLYISQSRFYIKKRLIVGNLVKTYFDETAKKYLYKWKVYIRDPDVQNILIDKFVNSVRYHLHSSYEPNNVVQVDEYPFLLTRSGWGEFVIRIELSVRGRKSPVEIHYPLRLKKGKHSFRYVLGNELRFDIELDKNNSLFTDDLSLTDESATQSSNVENAPDLFRIPGKPRMHSNTISSKSKFCIYCGTSLTSQKYLEGHQRNCEYKLEPEHINSYSPFPPISAREHSQSSLSESFLTDRRRHAIPTTDTFALLTNNVLSEMRLPGYFEDVDSGASIALGKATECFVKSLVTKALNNLQDNTQIVNVKATESNGKSVKVSKRMLTPIHIYNSVVADEKMDFLTNKYLLKS